MSCSASSSPCSPPARSLWRSRAAPAWAGFPRAHAERETRTPSEALLLGALRLKGWSGPGSLVLESRGPAADKTLAMAAAELVALRPEVLVSAGTPAIRALRDQSARYRS